MKEVKLLDLNHDWKQARPSLIKDVNEWFVSTGYQSFKISSGKIIPISDGLVTKCTLVKDTIDQDIIGKSVSDVGCSNMYFGFYSAINGANKVIGVDLDTDYIQINKFLINNFGFLNADIYDMNAVEYKTVSDTVFAFAIIHWVYSCSGFLGSLENVVKHFRSITGQCLYIEWIDPTDDCISDMLHHLDFNKEFVTHDYNKENFIRYLNEHFGSVTFLGYSKPTKTREIYRCLVK